MFLIVGDQMFRARHDTDALDSSDGLVCAFAVEIGIGAEAVAANVNGRDIVEMRVGEMIMEKATSNRLGRVQGLTSDFEWHIMIHYSSR
jgi:hypothetical protein